MKQRILPALGIAAGYFVAGKLALLLAIPPGYATAVWPAAGIALAGVLVWGYRVWPGILLGSFLVNVGTPSNFAIAAGIAAGATLQAIVAAFLVRRYVGYPNPLDSEWAVLKFLGLAGPVGCLVNATLGVTCLVLAGIVPSENAAFSWWTWWVGDSIGVIIFAPLTLIWFGEPRAVWRRRGRAVALPLGLTFALTVVLFALVSRWEEAEVRQQFERHADSLTHNLQKDWEAYLEILRSIRSFYVSSHTVERAGFESFVERALWRHDGIRALALYLRVRNSERAQFEEAIRREGFTDFRINERDAAGKTVPAAQRDEYFVITYIEPLAGNEQALGFDATTAAGRLAAMQRACETGRAIATGRVKLVQDTGGKLGLLVFQPIYTHASPPASIEERRRELTGYATGVFLIGDMLEASLEGADREGIDIQILDATAPQTERLLYQSLTTATKSPAAAGLVTSRTVEVAGRKWTLEYSVPWQYVLTQRSWASWSMLAGGVFFIGLLGAFLLVVTGRASVVEALVNERTAELRSTERKFRDLLESAPDAIIIVDAQASIVLVNSQTEKLFGYAREELIGKPIETLVPKRHHFKHTGHRDQYLRDPKLRTMGAGLELHGLRKDGSEFPVEVSLSPLETTEGTLVMSAVRDITERKRAEDELKQSREQLRSLAARLQSVREEERISIARRVHDELGQALTALTYGLGWLDQQLVKREHAPQAEPLRQRIKTMTEDIHSQIGSVRKICSELRPSVLDDLGLEAAIQWQSHEWESRTGIRCMLDLADGAAALDRERATAVFRIFQELLTNVVRHAGASEVQVRLTNQSDRLELIVRDNGRGIDETKIAHTDSFGLRAMRERAEVFGGRIDIRGQAGQGTRVTVWIPLKGASA